ncbi:MAG: hypothetical protein PWP40_2124 [Rhodocyclaceae bacterium]|nr:hypothetical protein [Rhodocyclaceae bacterium]
MAKKPYELLIRWDEQTGEFKGAHVRWSDMSLQPLRDGPGGYPLSDVLSTMQVDALAANQALRGELERIVVGMVATERALDEAVQARDAALSERDAVLAELTHLQQQIAEQAASSAASVPAHHLRRALRDAGLRDQVEALIASLPTDHPLRDDWEYAPHIRRDAQGIELVRIALKITPEHVDEIFRAAAAVRT